MKTRLTIRSDDTEVHVDGHPEDVRRELNRVLDRLLPAAGADRRLTISLDPVPRVPVVADGDAADDWKTAVARGDRDVLGLLRPVTLRFGAFWPLYSLKGHEVSLTRLPDTGHEQTGDILLLLLFGHLALLGEPSVGGIFILRQARRLGCRLQRMKAPFRNRPGLLRWSSGERRSNDYGLTEAGVRHCENLLRDLLAEPD